MAYMAKEERRLKILLAALDETKDKGFAGLTTRGIAARAQASTGIIHHHFSSLTELKCSVIRHLSQETLELLNKLEQTLPPAQALFAALNVSGTEEGQAEARLWISAADEATRSPEVCEAYSEEYNKLHLWTTNNLKRGGESNAYTLTQPADQIAWKLLALAFAIFDIAALIHTNLSVDYARQLILTELQSTLGLSDKDLARLDECAQ